MKILTQNKFIQGIFTILKGRMPTAKEEAFLKSRFDLSTLEEDVPTSLIHCSGRHYLYADRRWVTSSDDQYGTNYYQIAESGGTGAEPIYEWEHMGNIIPKGRKIKNLTLIGRTNNTQVTNLELRVVCKRPNPITRWETGIDNDSEVSIDVLFSGLFKTTEMTGNTNDMMKRLIDLGNYEVPEDSMLSLYVKPVGTLTGTRYFYSNWVFEIE